MSSGPAPSDQHGGQPGLAALAYDRLRDMVVSGAIAGGSPVQERKLAGQLSLSRTPVREALGRLEGEGLLRRAGGRLLCAEVSVVEVLETLAVRQSLEADAVQAAATRMQIGQIATLRAAILGMSAPDAITDAEHWDVDDRLHLAIAAASGNALLHRLIRDLRQRTRMFGLRRIPGRFDVGKAEHLAILDAVEARDPDQAALLMRRHIGHAADAIVAALSGPQR